jgi:hypothetical protein
MDLVAWIGTGECNPNEDWIRLVSYSMFIVALVAIRYLSRRFLLPGDTKAMKIARFLLELVLALIFLFAFTMIEIQLACQGR